MLDPLKWLQPDEVPDTARWESVRRPPRHTDEALTGTTRVWFRKLPAGRRPHALCSRFPRVANRIAWCWPDPALTQQVLEDLLVDRRGGREGFPRPIVAELRRLRDYRDRAHSGERAEGLWQALLNGLSGH